MMRILPAAARTPMPWKNGGGITQEIAIFPPGASIEDFDWRVSMAIIEADGSFSPFSGVDRILTVLEGCMALTAADHEPAELSPASFPFAFSGDIAVDAAVLTGPVKDLNVMTRRGRFKASVNRLRVNASVKIALSETTIVLARSNCVDVTYAAQKFTLKTDDAVLFDGESRGHTLVESHYEAVTLVTHIVKSDASIDPR